MKALALYAGPRALAHVRANGLQPEHVRAIAAAAGGPKGLILGALDRHIFGQWLPQSSQAVDLVGASIGAWRMATACTPDTLVKLHQLEHDYIHQDYAVEPGKKHPSAAHVSERFGHNIRGFFDGLVQPLLAHPRYRLHIVTSRGLGLLSRETHLAKTALGFAATYAANALKRQNMGRFMQRVVFSGGNAPMPFGNDGYPTEQVRLGDENFAAALQASCSIPFVLKAVHDIPGAPAGAYWDGGLTDYHLHMDRRYTNWNATDSIATKDQNTATPKQETLKNASGIVLYPHFQQQVVPGWLDKSFKSRHASTPYLDDMLLLAPTPEWVAQLPMAKLPDRSDFTHFGQDLQGRVAHWQRCTAAAQALADEWAEWLQQTDPTQVRPL